MMVRLVLMVPPDQRVQILLFLVPRVPQAQRVTMDQPELSEQLEQLVLPEP
jgi:hypothetical protein